MREYSNTEEQCWQTGTTPNKNGYYLTAYNSTYENDVVYEVELFKDGDWYTDDTDYFPHNTKPIAFLEFPKLEVRT